MGRFNALFAAAAGYEVRVYDNSAAALAALPTALLGTAQYMVDQQLLTAAAAEGGMPRIVPCATPQEAASEADLVTESVSEDIALKREIHGQFDELCPPRSILTTNTSNLLVSELEDAVERGDRFAALHSYFGSALFDIVGGPRTRPETIEALTHYVKSLGAKPLVLAKEHSGYLTNALFGALNFTAMLLVVHQQATPADVDRAWMCHAKLRWGHSVSWISSGSTWCKTSRGARPIWPPIDRTCNRSWRSCSPISIGDSWA